MENERSFLSLNTSFQIILFDFAVTRHFRCKQLIINELQE